MAGRVCARCHRFAARRCGTSRDCRRSVFRAAYGILEGEGLVNDATALVLFKFALTAVLTGVFSLVEATMTFAAIVVDETLWGLVVGWLMLRVRYWANEPRIEVTLSLLTPFLAFWIPHAAGASGVLATVVAGLYVGAKGVSSYARRRGCRRYFSGISSRTSLKVRFSC